MKIILFSFVRIVFLTRLSRPHCRLAYGLQLPQQQSSKRRLHLRHATTTRLLDSMHTGNHEDRGSSNDSISVYIPKTYSRDDGQRILEEQFFPKQQYNERIGLGRDAIFGKASVGALSPDDPRLTMTYAEFPLSSLDELIDLAITYLPTTDITTHPRKRRTTIIDIGSGCGRIVFYLGLTRGEDDGLWTIHGIEISKLLHDVAMDYIDEGVNAMNLFSPPTNSSTLAERNDDWNTIDLHYGPADRFPNLLGQADIIFAYSTAFPAPSFSSELGALVLNPEWSELLSRCCKPGCVAVTTDRCLDPSYDWQLKDRLDVENAEVVGSTGFIHVLAK